ncbi:hypothetical protein BAS09_11380 [Elizabethkingia ursingii]|nr:hypothetical protein BAS09_11380 [Elizabethkingia ursingii]
MSLFLEIILSLDGQTHYITKKKYCIPLYILLFILPISCEQIVDSFWKEKEKKNKQAEFIAAFKGTYFGPITGGVNGEIIINITDNGNIKVRINSSTNTDSLEAIYSDSGRIHGTSITTGLTIEGSLSEGKGTYKQGHWTGTWSVRKK